MKKRDEIKDIRAFAGGLFILLSVFAFISWYKDGNAWPYFIGTGILSAGIGLPFPKAFKPVYKGWIKIALFIGRVNTVAILSLTFYLLVTPIGILMRLFGKDFLDRNIDKNAVSYWKEREPERGISRYTHQF